MPGGRYLYAAGRDFHQVNNCVLLRCADSREGWATTSYQAEMALMTGAGIGVWYGDVRASGAGHQAHRRRGLGPLPKMQSGQRHRPPHHAGRQPPLGDLGWPAVVPPGHLRVHRRQGLVRGGQGAQGGRRRLETFPAPMRHRPTSASAWTTSFFEAYSNPSDHDIRARARSTTLPSSHMLRHGEPGFSVDRGDKSDESAAQRLHGDHVGRRLRRVQPRLARAAALQRPRAVRRGCA